jgi:aryl-alcohol dehydrogenase-like predicted oxidoreductase
LSSLAGGFFFGRFTRDNLDIFESYLDQICVRTYCYEENFGRFDRAAVLATEKGLAVPQIALAYALDQPPEIFALVGCNTGEEFASNVEAGAVELSPEELAWLENGDTPGEGGRTSSA